ncbi:L-lysine 6-transaminase [Rhodocaloribacter litoris]|uniref:L-lysine 6-transaminase n=1 Tax=Rhodocaloribacter litoris TaxID=2558931 RepID=UPI001421C247|nr:L-lysine 6-transaminase [Rhodocaloribacter litoris]QXD15931.1 L-lysine 6-transaminase [Rhodocaloribacter litoris]
MEAVSVNAITPQEVQDIFMAHLNARGMMPLVLDMKRSRGVELYDQLSGRRLLDFFGFYASSALGMNHPKLASDAAFMERLTEAALNKITNSDVRTVHMARFLKTFYRVAMPAPFKYAFFIEGGALAVENALKAAFDWKVRKNFEKGYRREVGHQVLHFDQAFHGRSGYTLSLTNTADPRKTMYFPRFDWPRVLNPKVTFPVEAHLEEIEKREQLALRQAKHYFYTRRDEIACIIIEPIQGEGGDNHFRPVFLQALKDLALENDALLIFDEVQTGIGITGSFWAYQGLGVEPDLISFGKKTQVCGILAGPRIDEVEDNVFHVGSRINSTWGGNLVDMVRFDRILEVIEEDDLVGHAATAGAHLLARLHELAGASPVVTNVRGRGLMCAFDLPTPEFRNRVLQHCYEQGVIILGCGTQSIRFRPPLTITEAEIDQGVELLGRAIRAVEKAYRPHTGHTGLHDALTDG